MKKWYYRYYERKLFNKVWCHYGYSLHQFRLGIHISRLEVDLDLGVVHFGVEWW